MKEAALKQAECSVLLRQSPGSEEFLQVHCIGGLNGIVGNVENQSEYTYDCS